jgi:DNA polymerase-3 subunit alpha
MKEIIIMSKPAFVHLHTHTDYSLLDSTIRIDELIAKAQEFDMPAVAITDSNNMCGAIEFYLKCRKSGIKPIIGAEISATSVLPVQEDLREQPIYKLVLLCVNLTGYRNLCRIVSAVCSNGLQEISPVSPSILAMHSEGLICLSGGKDGELTMLCRQGSDDALTVAAWYDEHFPDRYYIELFPEPSNALASLASIARTLEIPLVAAANCRCLSLEEVAAYQVIQCIRAGTTLDKMNAEKRTIEPLFYSSEKIWDMFGDCTEAIANTIKISDQCNLELPTGEYHMPSIGTPNDISSDELLSNIAWEGLKARMVTIRALNPTFTRDQEQFYQKRLQSELETIIAMQFADYFLIVADYVTWAKDNDIPVGPGRGSVGGSLVAYTLNITDIDPIPHGLIFERFLNQERKLLPYIYLDFCMDRRIELLEYLVKKYGFNRICKLSTFATYSTDSAISATGHVMRMSKSYIKKIKKMFHRHIGERYPGCESNLPNLRKQNLESMRRIGNSASGELNELAGSDPRVKSLLTIATTLRDVICQSSIDPVGIVIASEDIREFIAVMGGSGNSISSSQTSYRYFESVGLIRFDFLGLKNLTLNDSVVKLLRAKKHPTPDLQLLRLDNSATYDLIASGNTNYIFQFDSDGMRDLLMQLQPSCFEDIVAACAIYRPGPINNGTVDDLIARKHRVIPISYILPALEPILSNTYGILIYQEQAMLMAKTVAGYSLERADLLRRKLGRRRPKEVKTEKELFVAASVERGINRGKAEEVFERLFKSVEYSFLKAHAVAYALIAYQSAWLKANYPDEFDTVVEMSGMRHGNWDEEDLP